MVTKLLLANGNCRTCTGGGIFWKSRKRTCVIRNSENQDTEFRNLIWSESRMTCHKLIEGTFVEERTTQDNRQEGNERVPLGDWNYRWSTIHQITLPGFGKISRLGR